MDVTNGIEPNLFNITFNQLNLAVDKGFAGVNFNTPNEDFIYQLKYNNAVFSAFKTHRQQNDLAASLLDANGNLKSFATFKNDVAPIVGKYNQDWLKTEYNTAVIRARQAANFKKFEETKDLFPNLQWLPSTSIERRNFHVKFYNLVKPISDPFWKTNYPGDLWNCKCGITNTDDSVSEETPKAEYQPTPGLDENPGITGAIFSDTNTYRTSGYLKPSKLDKIAKAKANKVAYLPEILKQFKNGGQVITSNMVNQQATDYKDLVLVAKSFASEGKVVELLPEVHFKNELYPILFNGAYKNKCPDLLIGESFFEFESYVGPWNKNKISNMLRKGLKQSDKVIIDIRDGYATGNFIKKIADDMLKHKIKISEVWVLEDNSKVRRVF